MFEEGLAIFLELGDRAGVARMRRGLGAALLDVGSAEDAERALEEALQINRELGREHEIAICLLNLGSVLLDRGELERARSLYEESAALARELSDASTLAYGLGNLAELALMEDPVRAWSLGQEALELAGELRDDGIALQHLSVLSVAAARRRDSFRAGALWGAALCLDQELGKTWWRGRRGRPMFEDMLGKPGPEFSRGVEYGGRLTLEQAVAVAQAEHPSSG
jgi:tetratricopeptide (TPR) repeat protein